MHIPTRPAFIDQLARAYYASLARCVVLTGNIEDLYPVSRDGTPQFLPLDRVLEETLTGARYPAREEGTAQGEPAPFIIATLRSDGLHFASDADRAELEVLGGRLQGEQDGVARSAGSDLVLALKTTAEERASSLVTLAVIGGLLRTASQVRRLKVSLRPLALIIDHIDALFPSGDMARLSGGDREALKWFYDLMRDEDLWPDVETASSRPDFVVLLAPTAADINQKVMLLPRTVHLEVPLPDTESRAAFIRHRLERFPAPLGHPHGEGDPAARLVEDSRGLTLRALDDILTSAHRLQKPVDRASVIGEVNRQLSMRLGSIIKLVYPDHTMAGVVGFRRLKARLARLKQRIDNPERAPAGITVVGPNGAGKTFIFEAFAQDTGRAVITLSQIRSEWFGKTDAFAEQFESVLSAFGRILVIIDEAHAAFGSIQERETHETEARLTRHIIQMMDNESARGNIFWVLITTRPDLLDPDLVRRGRCSLFVPIFDPEGEDAQDFVTWMLRSFEKQGIALAEEEQQLLRDASAGFSAGDYREFISDFIDEREFDPNTTIRTFLANWTPSAVSIAEERDLQLHLAALRCDWRELLPERFKSMARAEIQTGIEVLKRQLGH